MNNSDMRVLVTGGAGFIGSHLCERLLSKGHRVVCLDSFNDFYDPAIKRENVRQALGHDNYELVEGDILDRELLDGLFEKNDFDAVAHLAAYAGVRPSIENPRLYQSVNMDGTLNLLECCRTRKVSKFVFASSSSVYGGRTEVPFKETDPVARAVSPYASTKAAGEIMTFTYHHLFGINVHALRFFTVFGPRQRPEMAIHLFASRMLTGEKIKVFGDGESSRDYTFITDIIDGVEASIERCSGYEVINLGGSATTTLSDLVRMISTKLNVEPVIERLPDQPGDVPITYADVAKAKDLLGYAPKVGIEEGIGLFCEVGVEEPWGVLN